MKDQLQINKRITATSERQRKRRERLVAEGWKATRNLNRDKIKKQRSAIERQDRHDYLQNTWNRYHEWINNMNEKERIIFRTGETENTNEEMLWMRKEDMPTFRTLEFKREQLLWMKISLKDTMLVRWMLIAKAVEKLDSQENRWIATKMETYRCWLTRISRQTKLFNGNDHEGTDFKMYIRECNSALSVTPFG